MTTQNWTVRPACMLTPGDQIWVRTECRFSRITRIERGPSGAIVIFYTANWVLPRKSQEWVRTILEPTMTNPDQYCSRCRRSLPHPNGRCLMCRKWLPEHCPHEWTPSPAINGVGLDYVRCGGCGTLHAEWEAFPGFRWELKKSVDA